MKADDVDGIVIPGALFAGIPVVKNDSAPKGAAVVVNRGEAVAALPVGVPVTAPTPERRVVERLTCSCPDWASGTEAINGPIIEKAVRSGLTWQFTGKKFRFCPWCGKALAPPAPEGTDAK